MGCLLNWHRAPVRLQLEHASGPFSLVASHRIYMLSTWRGTRPGKTRTFLRRHSSHARETLERFLLAAS